MSTSPRPKVYIAGPCTSSGTEVENLAKSIEAQRALMKAGFAVLNPVLTLAIPDQAEFSHDEWLEGCLPWVECADLIVRLPGVSKGADVEVAHALRRGVTVIASGVDLCLLTESEKVNVIVRANPVEEACHMLRTGQLIEVAQPCDAAQLNLDGEGGTIFLRRDPGGMVDVFSQTRGQGRRLEWFFSQNSGSFSRILGGNFSGNQEVADLQKDCMDLREEVAELRERTEELGAELIRETRRADSLKDELLHREGLRKVSVQLDHHAKAGKDLPHLKAFPTCQGCPTPVQCGAAGQCNSPEATCLPARKRFSQKDLLDLHEELSDRAHGIMKAKNEDYANPSESGNPFANFQGSSAFGIHPVLGVILRIQDKLKRLDTFSRRGDLKVKGEGWQDACMDVINYAVIIAGLIKSGAAK